MASGASALVLTVGSNSGSYNDRSRQVASFLLLPSALEFLSYTQLVQFPSLCREFRVHLSSALHCVEYWSAMCFSLAAHCDLYCPLELPLHFSSDSGGNMGAKSYFRDTLWPCRHKFSGPSQSAPQLFKIQTGCRFRPGVKHNFIRVSELNRKRCATAGT